MAAACPEFTETQSNSHSSGVRQVLKMMQVMRGLVS